MFFRKMLQVLFLKMPLLTMPVKQFKKSYFLENEFPTIVRGILGPNVGQNLCFVSCSLKLVDRHSYIFILVLECY